MKPAEPKDTLRLLVLSHMYPSRIDEGNGIFSHRHVQALREEGVELRVMSPLPWAPRLLWFRENWRHYGQMPRHEIWEGSAVERVPYLELPSKVYRPWAGYFMARALRPALERLYKTFPFNLIHSHTVTPDGLAAILLASRFGVPTVNSVRGSDLNEYPYSHSRRMRFTLRVLRETSRMLCVSRALSEVAQSLTCGEVCPGVVYNGVDQTVFHPAEDKAALRRTYGLPVDQRLLAFVGRCERDKGVAELLDAFTGLQKRFPDLYLVCLGEGGFRKELLRIAGERGLEGAVHAPGRADHGTVAGVLRSADLFCLPSWGEGMPNVLLEAMACGLPCVATRVGGIPEVLVDGRNGLLVEARDVRALESALSELLQNPDRASVFGQHARKTIQQTFSWRANARAHLEIYRSLLAGTAGGSGE